MSSSSSSSSSTKGVPVWGLVLIVLASGFTTLFLLWLCIRLIVRRRYARRVANDLERQTQAQMDGEALHDAAGLNAVDLGAKDGYSDPKKCTTSVELTYVVMAGEDQPSYLARAIKTTEESVGSEQPSLSPKKGDASEVPEDPEKTRPS